MTRLAMYMTAKGVFVLVSIFGAASCSSGEEIKWTEEVKLHDGSVIQIKRRTELSGTGFPAQKRGRNQYHEFCYAPMGIYWKSKPVYKPELFDIMDGKAYVKVPVSGCTECMLHDYPSSNALYFVWEGGQWKKVEQKDFPNQARFNLLSGTHSTDDRSGDARGLVTLAYKEKRDAGLYYDMRRTGSKTLSDLPGTPSCTRCRNMSVRTDATAEVFLPSDKRNCNW